ncbi:MAG: hypothetical protein J7J92_01030 [Candidatus Aenigmarchaeota archaeon]|nr:hypothetical protein [Candidatus Aenigmarchaeota archaeon]
MKFRIGAWTIRTGKDLRQHEKEEYIKYGEPPGGSFIEFADGSYIGRRYNKVPEEWKEERRQYLASFPPGVHPTKKGIFYTDPGPHFGDAKKPSLSKPSISRSPRTKKKRSRSKMHKADFKLYKKFS